MFAFANLSYLFKTFYVKKLLECSSFSNFRFFTNEEGSIHHLLWKCFFIEQVWIHSQNLFQDWRNVMKNK